MDVNIKFDEIKVKNVSENLFTVKVLMLKGEKGDIGYPSDVQVQEAVSNWLDDHPEATTTVEDGSITVPKFNASCSITTAQIDDLFA